MGSKCISLYNDETDELICRSCPVYGTVKGALPARGAVALQDVLGMRWPYLAWIALQTCKGRVFGLCVI